MHCSKAIGVALLLPFLGVSSLNFGPLATAAFFLGRSVSHAARRLASSIVARACRLRPKSRVSVRRSRLIGQSLDLEHHRDHRPEHDKDGEATADQGRIRPCCGSNRDEGEDGTPRVGARTAARVRDARVRDMVKSTIT